MRNSVTLEVENFRASLCVASPEPVGPHHPENVDVVGRPRLTLVDLEVADRARKRRGNPRGRDTSDVLAMLISPDQIVEELQLRYEPDRAEVEHVLPTHLERPDPRRFARLFAARATREEGFRFLANSNPHRFAVNHDAAGP